MCGSMADIQSAAAEIRRGKKKRKKKKKNKPQHENIMVCPIFHRATIMKEERRNHRTKSGANHSPWTHIPGELSVSSWKDCKCQDSLIYQSAYSPPKITVIVWRLTWGGFKLYDSTSINYCELNFQRRPPTCGVVQRVEARHGRGSIFHDPVQLIILSVQPNPWVNSTHDHVWVESSRASAIPSTEAVYCPSEQLTN